MYARQVIGSSASTRSPVCPSACARLSRNLSIKCVAKPPATKLPAAKPAGKSTDAIVEHKNLTSGAMLAIAPFLLDVNSAMATGGQYGILEGRTAALIHPAMNFFLLGSTLYAGYLGLQWRRTREIGEEIRSLRAAQPAGSPDTPAPANPELEQKEKERKELIAGNYRDKHWMWSSLILAGGVGIAIAGCANTFMRTGKLFPGPHLYAGATIVALWAFAAALVPAMQKGNNTARNAHIVANSVNVLLFLWQVPTGLEIVDKVFQFTQWP